ncbi:MAG: hypothetical protein ACJ74O_09290 [Frankiaceae bacterium]
MLATGDQALDSCMALLAAGVPLTLLVDLADLGFPVSLLAELLDPDAPLCVLSRP